MVCSLVFTRRSCPSQQNKNSWLSSVHDERACGFSQDPYLVVFPLRHEDHLLLFRLFLFLHGLQSKARAHHGHLPVQIIPLRIRFEDSVCFWCNGVIVSSVTMCDALERALTCFLLLITDIQCHMTSCIVVSARAPDHRLCGNQFSVDDT